MPSLNKYVIGSEIRLLCTFTNQAGVAQDPTYIAAYVRQPDCSLLSFSYSTSIVRDGVGEYRLDFVPTQSGSHSYRFAASGEVIAAGEKQFIIQPSIVI
jgi:hypothetical protein